MQKNRRAGRATLLALALLAAAPFGGNAARAAVQAAADATVTTSSENVRKAFAFIFAAGPRPKNAVRVPFTKQNGLIIVQATLGDKVLPCVLDTGDPLVRWPKRLQLAGKATGIHAMGQDVSGAGAAHEMVLLSRVRIGTYELTNVPSWAVGAQKPSPDDAAAPPDEGITGGVWQRYPVLGNVVFEQVALTIDYRKSELILRPRGVPDAAATPRRTPGTRTLPVQRVGPVFTGESGAAHGGFLALAGTVEGRPVNFLLDTGLPFETGIVLAPNKRGLLAAEASRQEVQAVTGLGQVSADRFTNVSWSLNGGAAEKGDVIIPTQFALLGDNKTSIDALVGAYLLQNYRVTIDYPRARVLLEPYAAATEAAVTR